MIFVLILVLSRDTITFFAFKLNQDFIANELCINKEKPELNCHGKCHLNNELKKNNNENSHNKSRIPQVKQETQ